VSAITNVRGAAPSHHAQAALRGKREQVAEHDASGQAIAQRKATLMAEWEKQHARLKRLTPSLYAERRKAYEQSIGGH
jgi:hypothetical protein